MEYTKYRQERTTRTEKTTVSDPDGGSDATWVETKNGVKVTGDEINMKFKDNDGKLECKILGVHMFFEKQ